MVQLIIKALLVGCLVYGGVCALNTGIDNTKAVVSVTTQNTSDCFIYGTGC